MAAALGSEQENVAALMRDRRTAHRTQGSSRVGSCGTLKSDRRGAEVGFAPCGVCTSGLSGVCSWSEADIGKKLRSRNPPENLKRLWVGPLQRDRVSFRQQHFLNPRNCLANISPLFLTWRVGLISFKPSRTDTERAAVVFAAWNGARRSADFDGSGCLQISCLEADGETTARRADGTSECPGGSPHERGALTQATDPGTSSRPINPSVCGTLVRNCVRGPGPARTTSRV